jgi:hypothetical protein
MPPAAACHRHPQVDRPITETKVEEWQRANATDAANRFRESFNTSTCEPMYNAAAAYFRTQSSREWVAECEQLKKKLGSWRSFQVTDTQRCASREVVVCVHGLAEFENGVQEIDTAWLLNSSGPQLFWIAIKRDERHWRQIPEMPFLHKLIDPIPIKVIQNG